MSPEKHGNATLPKIVFLDRATLDVEIGRPKVPHAWKEFPSSRDCEVVERLAGARVAITNKVGLSKAELSRLPELKMIAVAATGTNNVDVGYCRAHGIIVSNIRGYANSSVPEHVFCMILALKRNLLAYRRDIGRWKQSGQFCLPIHPITDISGSTFGIVGFGALGEAVARLAKCFGAQVLIAERKGASACREGYTPFQTALKECDILSLHCPLTDETRGLIGMEELKLMKCGALLINTARGGLVDEHALAHALRHGLIGGAGFDVLIEEPPLSGSPLLDVDLPNFLLTPHVAWTSNRAMAALSSQLIANIDAFLEGNPRNNVA